MESAINEYENLTFFFMGMKTREEMSWAGTPFRLMLVHALPRLGRINSHMTGTLSN